MALEVSLKEFCNGLKSNRITDRKRNAEALKEYLLRNAVPILLTENTLKKKGYTWTDLFVDINEYILKEIEKYDTSKTFDTVTGPLCTSLLHLCVAGSNKGGAYVKCNKVIEACLYILKDKHLLKAIGDAYLNLLYKHILPYDYYLGYIAPTTWEELLDISLYVCTRNHSKLDDFTKLRLLFLIVKSGTNNCQIIISLRNSLCRFENCVLKVSYDKKAQEVIVEIIILLLETLSTECRLTMCHFTEKILSPVLKFYDQNIDPKKKVSLFKLLHGTIILHHPFGRTLSEEGSLAHDWEIWNRRLNGILEIICLEVAYIQKSHKQNNNLSKTCTYFFSVAASVYYQIFKQFQTQPNELVESYSKRQKITPNKSRTFIDLLEELKQNHIPWLGVIQTFVKSHGQCITFDEYIMLLNVLDALVLNSKTDLIWVIYGELTCLVLERVFSNTLFKKEDHIHVITSLWDSCVRNSPNVSAGHRSLHTIMQCLLLFDVLAYQTAEPLIKFYFEKSMPVSESSVKTLSVLMYKFFNKCSSFEFRISCFSWFSQDINIINAKNTVELFLRLLGNENTHCIVETQSNDFDVTYNTLFNSIEKCILFSEFEYQIPEVVPVTEKTNEHNELISEVENKIQDIFINQISKYIGNMENKHTDLSEYLTFVNIVLVYFDTLIKYFCATPKLLKKTKLCDLLNYFLKKIFTYIKNALESKAQIPVKIKLLRSTKKLLITDFNNFLNVEIRSCIDSGFFHCLNNIILNEPENDDELIEEEDEEDTSVKALKHHCIYVLAAFCRTRGDFSTEVLELILDPKIYNLPSDFRCALTCIELLNSRTVEQPPIGLMFTLMANMCKVLYRDSEATFSILQVLVKMLDLIWTQDATLKLNCYIMVKGYLQRCEKLFYAPYIVPLIYNCGVKIIELNKKDNGNLDNILQDSLVHKLKDDIHCIRLYCCHLLKFVIGGFSDEDVDEYLATFSDIYLVDVAETIEEVLKDEAANRTLTILHSFAALVNAKKSLLFKIIIRIMILQKDKSLNETLVKKVLNKLVHSINNSDIETYLSDNILSVLHFWFTHSRRIDELPLSLFGCDKLEVFHNRYNKWLFAADSLWNKMGNIGSIDFTDRQPITLENVVESCFCNIIALCLPHIVTEKYKIDCTLEESRVLKSRSENANRMFQQTGKILPSDKWTNIFVENVGELLLLTTLHLCDYEGTTNMFEIEIRRDTKSYFYPKKVFCAILDYIGELTDGNIMQYLCEHLTLVMFQILIRLWENVIKEHVLELKALALHAYLTVIECLPLENLSDVFVCNFACQSVIHSLKKCYNHEEMKLLTKTLFFILERFLPSKAELIQKKVPEIISIIAVKNDEGFEKQCAQLQAFLTRNIKKCLKESKDVVDFVNTMSQGGMGPLQCTTTSSFMEKLKTFRLNLLTPSYKTLLNLKDFLKLNNNYVNELCYTLDPKGFSEDCKTSIIHQLVCSLNVILTSSQDEKILTEACNCLSEIRTYDLKTLVTVPPPDTQNIVDVNPKKYFVFVVVKSLVDTIFDENTKLADTTLETLNSLMKFVENIDSLGLDPVYAEILKSLHSSSNLQPIEITLNNRAFDEYCTNYSEGIFTATLMKMSGAISSPIHSNWLQEVTCTLLKFVDTGTDYVKSLQLVCESKSDTCREILPALIGVLLHCSSEKYLEIISQHINSFFYYIWDQFCKHKVDTSGDIFASHHCHKMIIEYMLAIVDFVRLQRKHYASRPNKTFETYNYLKIDYDKVAWAASVADHNLAAVYYGELWAMSQNAGVPPSSPESTTNLEGGEQIQRIFRKCYVSIGEMDAIDGCGTAHLTIEEEKRKHLINTGQFADALLLHDIALSCGVQKDPRLEYGVVRSLHKSGMHHLALQYIKSLPEQQELEDIKYECLAFLGDWSEFVDTKDLEVKINQPNCNPNSLLIELHYACLKDCLTHHNSSLIEGKIMQILNKSKLAIHRLCQNLNMDNCQNTYRVMSKLHLLTDIEDFLAVRTKKSSINDIVVKWQVRNLPNYNDFKHLEALISQRALILQHAAIMFKEAFNEICSLQIQYAELGLSNNKIQMAERVLAMAKKLRNSEEINLVESEISWAKGHKEIALSLLRNLVCDQPLNNKNNAISLRHYGLWMADTKRDNTRDIINKYLLKSLDILKNDDHKETRLKVYYDIAKFADAEYKQVASYMESSIFENKVKCLESMKGTASSLRSTQQSLTRDEKKAFFVNDRFRELDEAEIANTKAEKHSYLQLAMRYYLKSLKQCEDNNLSVFRVISLWFNNPDFEFEETSNGTFSGMLHDIPSRKFITVLPQIAPRISTQKTNFDNNLTKIIKKCAVEHPHHTLPILFSLKNSDKDKVILNASGSSRKTTAKSRNPEPRVLAADAVVKELSQENRELASIIAQMEKMCDATISFANYKPITKDIKQEIPSAENIRKLSKLNAIPVPTVTIPIQNDCRYLHIPSVHSFENIFELVGGINCPKKVYCTDSTGKKRILLIKGEDDMRQDAVMQQVFNIVNTLLGKDPVTSRNKLLIRTYKVVPMSRQSGVLEWCVGTIPLGAYLVGVGNTGAHARYRPKDITSHAARMKLTECHEKRRNNKEKLAVFLKILKDFKPVFHYFFTENFLNPVTWYERRLAYTKSVSTSSMVGYILGLGDRHVQNILIDKSTAEVIHIDFGIAFDQGKTLHTPETVPFRLTQDIIAGFGASGVEGIFRRCCEKTMQLLRNNQETLLTILEVLLCDPLYTWTVTTAHQNVPSVGDHGANNASSKGSKGSKSSLAERALLTVSSKLGGAEGGLAAGVAVPGHVARLLQAAADPANLCRLFPGWQPYL